MREFSFVFGQNYTKYPHPHVCDIEDGDIVYGKSATDGDLSVDDVSVLVAVFVDERLVVLCHTTQRHTHA